MKYSSGSLFAMLAINIMLAGCASTGTTPTSTPEAPASENQAPANSGGSEPECD